MEDLVRKEYYGPFRILDAYGVYRKRVSSAEVLLVTLANFRANRMVAGFANPVYPPSIVASAYAGKYFAYPVHRAYGVHMVVVDDLGQVIPRGVFLDWWEERFEITVWRWWGRDDFRFRNGPVPRTRCARWRKGGWFRKPRTQQERAAAQLIDDEDLSVRVRVRSKRNTANLPEARNRGRGSRRQVERDLRRSRCPGECT